MVPATGHRARRYFGSAQRRQVRRAPDGPASREPPPARASSSAWPDHESHSRPKGAVYPRLPRFDPAPGNLAAAPLV